MQTVRSRARVKTRVKNGTVRTEERLVIDSQDKPSDRIRSPRRATEVARIGVTALLLAGVLGGCAGSPASKTNASRTLTVDRPNAPFCEPQSIRGVTPLAQRGPSQLATSQLAQSQFVQSQFVQSPFALNPVSSNPAAKGNVVLTPSSAGVVANAMPASTSTSSNAPTPPGANEATSPAPVQIVGNIVRGDRSRGDAIAEVDIERCFAAIPSYRSMQGDRNSRDYARYLLTITAANEEFRDAVEDVALRDGFDLVVEKGGVRGAKTVDITAAVCERISEQKVTIAR